MDYNPQAILVIDSVLLNNWDPIGVQAEPDARDEYESYALLIYGELLQGSTDDAISDMLEEIRTQQMGLPPNRPASIQATQALRIAFVQLQK
jgi:hypothetical protein